MKRFSSQLNKKAQNVRLSLTERALLRERLVSYMEYHPLPKQMKKTTLVAELTSDPYKAFTVSRLQLGSFMGAFTMIMLVVVPVVAERAVPGDVLYPVKVQFNEEVRSTLSFSPYAKVEWETERLERRLAEARLLADEGKLTEEIEAEVAEAVQAHSDAAQESIATIRSNDSDEAALAEIAFASALEVQSEVLANREEQSGEPGRSVSILASAVAEAREGVAASNSMANPSFEKLLARLESETTYAEELFTSVQSEATGEQVQDIERRFDDIKRKIDEAVNLHTIEASEEGEATSETESSVDAEHEAKQVLKAALADTRKLISFMTDIDVRSSVTIDELVPVTLTEEERRADLNVRLKELTVAKENIEQTIVDLETVEKFDAGKAQFLSTYEAANSAYQTEDVENATRLIEEAELIAKDLMLMGTQLPKDPNDKATSTDTDVATSSESTSTSSSETEIRDREPRSRESRTE